MSDSMLHITNGEEFLNALEFAQESGTFNDLINRIRRLESWGEDHDQIDLKLWATSKHEIEFTLNSNNRFVIVGGIIYHPAMNGWGTHT